MVDVIGIGALNWDRLYLVNKSASSGEEIIISNQREEAGGSAANTIAALGRINIDCGFIGVLGADSVGEKIIDSFIREGVDTSGIIKTKGNSGQVLAFVDRFGERTMYVNPGVNDNLRFNELDLDYLSSGKYVHASSFAGENSMASLKKVADEKRDFILSFAPGFLCKRGIDYLEPILKNCGFLFLNEMEARALTGDGLEGSGIKLRKLGVGTVVITLGKHGCFVSDETDTGQVEGEKVDVVDSTGAGDAFAAGFLYGTINEFDEHTSARIGNYVASRCVEKLGARSGLPTRDSVEKFIRKNF